MIFEKINYFFFSWTRHNFDKNLLFSFFSRQLWNNTFWTTLLLGQSWLLVSPRLLLLRYLQKSLVSSISSSYWFKLLSLWKSSQPNFPWFGSYCFNQVLKFFNFDWHILKWFWHIWQAKIFTQNGLLTHDMRLDRYMNCWVWMISLASCNPLYSFFRNAFNCSWLYRGKIFNFHIFVWFFQNLNEYTSVMFVVHLNHWSFHELVCKLKFLSKILHKFECLHFSSAWPECCFLNISFFSKKQPQIAIKASVKSSDLVSMNLA